MRVIRHLVRSRVGATVTASLVALAVLSGVRLVPIPSIAVSGRAASSGGVINHFTPIYMGGYTNYSLAQATALAQQFDVIAEHGATFAPFMSAMHLANPALKIVTYLNGAYDTTPNGTAYPPTWYAHDSSGNRIRSVGFGNWLMDPTTPQWAPNVAGLCSAALSRTQADGCFLDSLGVAPLHPGYVTGVPVDPATHQAYAAATWISAQTNTVSAVAGVTTVIVTNGLGDGSAFPQTNPLLAVSHLAMAELWLRGPSSPPTAFPSTATWLADVNMLVDAETHGWGVMTVTKLWVTATPAQVTQWHKFTLASFLMGAGGRSAYNFTPAKTSAGMTATNSYDSVAIGAPIGSYSLRSGVYQRSFTNGIAIVNPGTSPVTVAFGTSYTNLDGTVVTQETLAPDSGDVLVTNAASGISWSFEGTTQNWAGGGAKLVPSTVEAYSGAYSLRMTVTANGPAYALSPHPFAGSAIRPAHSVSLSMRVRAASVGRYAQAILDWYTATGSFISQTLGTPALSSTSTWMPYSVTGIAPPTAAFYGAEFFVGNGSLAGEVSYIDRVTATVS